MKNQKQNPIATTNEFQFVPVVKTARQLNIVEIGSGVIIGTATYLLIKPVIVAIMGAMGLVNSGLIATVIAMVISAITSKIGSSYVRKQYGRWTIYMTNLGFVCVSDDGQMKEAKFPEFIQKLLTKQDDK